MADEQALSTYDATFKPIGVASENIISSNWAIMLVALFYETLSLNGDKARLRPNEYPFHNKLLEDAEIVLTAAFDNKFLPYIAKGEHASLLISLLTQNGFVASERLRVKIENIIELAKKEDARL